MKAYMRIALRELKSIFSDRRIFSIMLAGPFFYGLVFGGVYYYGRVRQVDTMVVDQDHSALSRQLVSALDASDSLRIATYAESPSDFSDAVKRGTAYLCIVIPDGFERDLKTGKQARVAALADASNVLIANVCYRAARSTIVSFGAAARARRLMMDHVPRSALKSEISPIQSEIRPLFNPSYNYSNFLLVALVCIAFQQVTMMGAAISLAMEGQGKGMSELRGISQSPLMALLGKATAHGAVMVPLAWAGLLVPFRLFHTPFHGAWPVIMGATAVFVVINTLSGFGVAGICRTPVLSTQILLVLSVPVFTLSGATWPIFAMPEWLQCVSRLIPLTHFANIVRKVSLIGVPVQLFRQDVVALAVWLAVSAAWAYWAIRRMTNDAHT